MYVNCIYALVVKPYTIFICVDRAPDYKQCFGSGSTSGTVDPDPGSKKNIDKLV